jgi:hypothetical protein
MSIHQFLLRGQPQMTAFSWSERLDLASSEWQVVQAVREFVASLEPREIGMLPEECRPGKFFDAADVTLYAFILARHRCGDDSEAAALVAKLSQFFSDASIRLSRIMAAPNERLSA